MVRQHNKLVTVTCNRERIRVHLSMVSHLTEVTLNKLQLATHKVSMIITASNSLRHQTVVEAQLHQQTRTVTTRMHLVMVKLVRDTSKMGMEVTMPPSSQDMAKLGMTSNRVVTAAPLTRVKRKIHLKPLRHHLLSLDKLGMEQLVKSLPKVALVKQRMELLRLLKLVTAASHQRLTVLGTEHHHRLENHRLMLRTSSLQVLLEATGMHNQLHRVMDSLLHMGMVRHLRDMGLMEDTHSLQLLAVTLLMDLLELLLLVVVVVVRRLRSLLQLLDRLRHPQRVDDVFFFFLSN